jgi:starch synthase
MLVASEGMPFIKTGGLADVIGSLPKELIALGAEAAVIMPLHAKVKSEWSDKLEFIADAWIGLGWKTKYMGLFHLEQDGVQYYFIDNEEYFGGPVYKGGVAEVEQYAYFCRAVLSSLNYITFKPDILHCNDYHTGMIPMLLKTQYQNAEFAYIKTMYTIHNMQFQGKIDFKSMQELLSIPSMYNTPEFIEAHDDANMMKAALVFSDLITTVSPNYANELTNAYFAMGMEGIINARRHQLIGIVNGIDYDEFDPAKDPTLAKHYTIKTIENKLEDKKALCQEFGFDPESDAPIISMVTRMTKQKGLDLVMYALEELLQSNVRFIMLGSGDFRYHEFFNYIAGKYPGTAGIYIGYDEDKAHRIYAGSDFFLMPSLFEPCGLSQMISQRYGTLPIVRETGGLVDTVIPYNKFTGEGDGFSFKGFNAHEMLGSIYYALEVYYDKDALKLLQENAMLKDNSFHRSAEEYMKHYGGLYG